MAKINYLMENHLCAAVSVDSTGAVLLAVVCVKGVKTYGPLHEIAGSL